MIKIIIKEGKFHFANKESMYAYLKIIDSYSNSGKILTMTIEEFSANTTEAQYKLFKALLIKGSEISGYTYKEFEDELINNFAPYKYEKSILGEMVKSRKKVSEMKHNEFNIFMEQCIQFCKEFYNIIF